MNTADPVRGGSRSDVRVDLTPDELAGELEARAFRRSGGPARPPLIGLEVELLPYRTESRRRVLLDGGAAGPILPELLRAAARSTGSSRGPRANARGERAAATAPHAVPALRTPRGGVVSFEPGGQLEYSSPPARSVTELLRIVERELEVMFGLARAGGVELRGWGIDPRPGCESVPLQLRTPRYRRMARHLESGGPAGTLMMRHTCAVHVNLDWIEDPLEEWEVANRIAPLLIAIFANSPRFLGRETGFRSFRMRQWCEIDPARTGIVRRSVEDPVGEYLDFALGAPAFLLGPDEDPARPLAEWLEAGPLGRRAWDDHLSTLFPEIRPRGYLEVRCVDALDPRWYAAPAVLVMGLLHDRTVRRMVLDLLPVPASGDRESAARLGLSDPGIRRRAEALVELGMEGAERLGDRVGAPALQWAADYFSRYTFEGRSPADDPPEPPGGGVCGAG